MSDQPMREASLEEFVKDLPETHRVRKELKTLKKDSDLLECLNGAGVDNWDGYDYAMEDYRKIHPDED